MLRKIFIPMLFISLVLTGCDFDSFGNEVEGEVPPIQYSGTHVSTPPPTKTITPNVPSNVRPVNNYLCENQSDLVAVYNIYKPGITSGTVCEVINGLTGQSLWRANNQAGYCEDAVQNQIRLMEEAYGVSCTESNPTTKGVPDAIRTTTPRNVTPAPNDNNSNEHKGR